ncbi:unnamed protein product [Clonostachys rosea]|uniref:Uncharacterized protein n=1 Tax=Bionectria ochroleuca TaxID=29856 RepID=A0ABY6UD92_BIOOC|nr:unnamed protein product [Clonostachys rosea]
MAPSRLPLQLATELAKIAKLSNVQSALPSILRQAPTIAIMAGGAIARGTGSDNFIEQWIQGKDEALCLGAPIGQSQLLSQGNAALMPQGQVARHSGRRFKTPIMYTEDQFAHPTWNRPVWTNVPIAAPPLRRMLSDENLLRPGASWISIKRSPA